MAQVHVKTQLPDGGVLFGMAPVEKIKLVRTFEHTIGMIYAISWAESSLNAVEEPLTLIGQYLSGDDTKPAITVKFAISGDTKHAQLALIVMKQKLELAYLAHIEDYTVCDCRVPYNWALLRNTSYNWLGFMWMPFSVDPFEVRSFMYCTKSRSSS